VKRVYLSPPHLSGRELEFVRDAFESNWVAPLGPHVDAFEREFVQAVMVTSDERGTRNDERGAFHACALSSGTAALHLALRMLAKERETGGERQSNEVLCSTFTFAASANAITYEGLTPVFVDCDEASWNMDPELLREELAACAKRGKLPRAVLVVDLYGQCADYDPITEACAEFGVPLIEDAAEALGAVYWGQAESEGRSQKAECRSEGADAGGRREASVSGSQLAASATDDGRRTRNTRSAGSFGAAAVFSFNGNKVITTAGGGMLVSQDKAVVDKARFLATQARDKAPHYQHSEIGFNYRMSNILAAVGRGQLPVLAERIAARRRNFDFYRRALGDLPGIAFMPEAPYGRCTRWLTCLTMGGAEAEVKAEVRPDSTSTGPRSSVLRLLEALEAENIEARPLWKPMHLQPVFDGCRIRGGAVSEGLFANGFCLPSGSALTEAELGRICDVVRGMVRPQARP